MVGFRRANLASENRLQSNPIAAAEPKAAKANAASIVDSSV
jgi:hypothetical protein